MSEYQYSIRHVEDGLVEYGPVMDQDEARHILTRECHPECTLVQRTPPQEAGEWETVNDWTGQATTGNREK